ncbi:MAG: esterase [Cytophagaceae bacterium SCN 52-12]|nr:MAG: esterase [Cytophagaceae bacterium SCN 52-12]
MHSAHLHRDVIISLILPANYLDHTRQFRLIIFQDGQDFPALHLSEIVAGLVSEGAIPPVIIAGIHANEKRIYEYGIAAQADYKGRGDRAGAHTRFVTEELLPYLEDGYPVNTSGHTIAGFSLGGLMALDIAWNHPGLFSRAGVFSGSLWWRQKAFGEEYHDSDRIMHRQIATGSYKPGLKFWFQTGDRDETCDRNNDGVIDSISDTLDCIAELEKKGYRWGDDVQYLEIKGGEHHPGTWRKAMPAFLKWALTGRE